MSNTEKSINTNPPTKLQKQLLSEIVEATNSATGFTYVSEAKAKPLVDRGLIELNTGMKNDAGHFAARATTAGIEVIMGNNTEAAQSDDATENTTQFELDNDVAIPESTRRTRTAIYPFDSMEPGQSFHVPATAERPNPAKSLASTVSSANKRYAVVIPGETRVDRKGNTVPATRQERRFRVVAVDSGDVRGVGARVFRVE